MRSEFDNVECDDLVYSMHQWHCLLQRHAIRNYSECLTCANNRNALVCRSLEYDYETNKLNCYEFGWEFDNCDTCVKCPYR